MENKLMIRPKARKDGLHITEMDSEVLVYDPQNCKAHYLNPTTSRVWQLCDGAHTVAELADVMARKEDLAAAEPVVELALEQLSRRNLLEEPVTRRSPAERRSRRKALKKMAAVLVAVPAVMTVTAQPALAQLTIACTQDSDCSILGFGPCSRGKCVNGRCRSEAEPDGTVVISGTGPCSDLVCQGGVTVTASKPNGTPCLISGEIEGVCMNGNCVTQTTG